MTLYIDHPGTPFICSISHPPTAIAALDEIAEHELHDDVAGATLLDDASEIVGTYSPGEGFTWSR